MQYFVCQWAHRGLGIRLKHGTWAVNNTSQNQPKKHDDYMRQIGALVRSSKLNIAQLSVAFEAMELSCFRLQSTFIKWKAYKVKNFLSLYCCTGGPRW